MITVFLVENEPLVREGLRMWLGLAGDITVVGETATGEHAVEAIPAVKPDVVIMDLLLPGIDGVTTIEQLRSKAPSSAVIVLSLRDNDKLRSRALDAGAHAFVAKHEPNEALLAAIRQAAPS